MKLCILGATGASGRRLVREALTRGHTVDALARSAAKASALAGDGLSIREVPFTDEAALADAMSGSDVVINAAGYITDGEAYVPLVHRIIRAADIALGSGGRFWLFGGGALLDVPGTSLMTLDLPGVPKIYQAHRTNYLAVRRTELDWSMLCPGPMIDSPDGKATDGLIVSKEIWPVERPALTRVLPRLALTLAFKNAIDRMTIFYEDAARVVLDHVETGGPLSRQRVGVALPAGERRTKTVVQNDR